MFLFLIPVGAFPDRSRTDRGEFLYSAGDFCTTHHPLANFYILLAISALHITRSPTKKINDFGEFGTFLRRKSEECSANFWRKWVIFSGDL
jgi:hypothetical protein